MGICLGEWWRGAQTEEHIVFFYSFFFLLLSYRSGHVYLGFCMCVCLSLCVCFSFYIFGTERAWTHLGCCIEDTGSLF